MKEEGRGSKKPLTESFFHYPNNKYVLLALLGATAGQGVVWYTGQFYALFFLHDHAEARLPHGLPADRRLAADRHAVLHLLRLAVRPDRAAEDHPGGLRHRGADLLPAVRRPDPLRQSGAGGVRRPTPRSRWRLTIAASTSSSSPARCSRDCDKAKDFLTKSGLSFESIPAVPGQTVVTTIGTTELQGWDEAKYKDALKAAGYPAGGRSGERQLSA